MRGKELERYEKRTSLYLAGMAVTILGTLAIVTTGVVLESSTCNLSAAPTISPAFVESLASLGVGYGTVLAPVHSGGFAEFAPGAVLGSGIGPGQ